MKTKSQAVAESNRKRKGQKFGPVDKKKQAPVVRKQKTILMSDVDQLALNIHVNRKSNLFFEYKSYKPGTPEFDAIAATITPIKRVRKGCSADVIHLYQEVDPTYLLRRNESTRELR